VDPIVRKCPFAALSRQYPTIPLFVGGRPVARKTCESRLVAGFH